MQVKELITFYINETSNTIDVSFRLETDGDDEIRNDSILIDTVGNFGYEFLNRKEEDIYDDDDFVNENYNDYSDNILDEDEIISFLNEYYMINPTKLPTVELF